MGEIDRGIYEKITGKLKNEMTELNLQLDNGSLYLSNPLEVVNKALEITSNLVNLWVTAGSKEKKNLQNLLFPKGLLYDRKIEHYRTDEVNPILALTHSFSEALNQNKSGQKEKDSLLSTLVAPAGIEPASSESESEILSIEIRGRDTTENNAFLWPKQARSAKINQSSRLKNFPPKFPAITLCINGSLLANYRTKSFKICVGSCRPWTSLAILQLFCNH